MFEKQSEVVLFRNAVIKVVKLGFSLPDGLKAEREVVRHPGTVSVIPLLADNKRVILMSQFRASIERDLVEAPAGKRDVPGESPVKTATRELEEELGIRCSSIVPLCEFYNSPGFSDEHSYSFLAMGLTLGNRSPQSVEEARSEGIIVELDHIPELISLGIVSDARTMIGLYKTASYLAAQEDERRRSCTMVNDVSMGLSDSTASDDGLLLDWVNSLRVL